MIKLGAAKGKPALASGSQPPLPRLLAAPPSHICSEAVHAQLILPSSGASTINPPMHVVALDHRGVCALRSARLLLGDHVVH